MGGHSALARRLQPHRVLYGLPEEFTEKKVQTRDEGKKQADGIYRLKWKRPLNQDFKCEVCGPCSSNIGSRYLKQNF